MSRCETTAATTTDTSGEKESPFTTAALNTDVGFWLRYIAGRPSPPDDFFQLINRYHKEHGDGSMAVAHDVGTGPGNIAQRLLNYYDHVVGSDVNEKALDAARALLPPEHAQRTTFIKSPAEALGIIPSLLPADIGPGRTDLVVVSECMPLLDAPPAMHAFHTLLRPGGTLAIYFYGRPIFVDGSGPGDAAACDAIYDRLATRICSFLLPFKGTPGFAFHQRGVEGLASYLDNIAVPPDAWKNVQRHKWNCHRPLLFNSKEGFDFEFGPVDRRAEGETCFENVPDAAFWAQDWDTDRVAQCLASVYPNYMSRAGAGDRDKIDQMLEELKEAMGGGSATMNVTFPVVLILATRR